MHTQLDLIHLPHLPHIFLRICMMYWSTRFTLFLLETEKKNCHSCNLLATGRHVSGLMTDAMMKTLVFAVATAVTDLLETAFLPASCDVFHQQVIHQMRKKILIHTHMLDCRTDMDCLTDVTLIGNSEDTLCWRKSDAGLMTEACKRVQSFCCWQPSEVSRKQTPNLDSGPSVLSSVRS